MNTLPALPASRARELVGCMRNARVVVIGDVMLDEFIVGRVSRISPEAPVPVVAFDHEQHRAGGAANVALNIAGLGATADVVSVVGDDGAAATLTNLLKGAGLQVNGLVTDGARRTSRKVRIVTTRNQQVARVDYETEDDIGAEVESAIAGLIDARVPGAGAVVVSDYLKGVITRGLMARIIAIAHEQRVPVLVDPKIPHLDYYEGATLVTPNHVEAEIATHMRIRSEADAQKAAAVFRERAHCDGVLITRGEQGMWLLHDDANGHLPATAREVSDVTGAGDTVVAVMALAIAARASSVEAAHLANEAAGVVVGKFGPAAVTPDELLSRFARV